MDSLSLQLITYNVGTCHPTSSGPNFDTILPDGIRPGQLLILCKSILFWFYGTQYASFWVFIIHSVDCEAYRVQCLLVPVPVNECTHVLNTKWFLFIGYWLTVPAYLVYIFRYMYLHQRSKCLCGRNFISVNFNITDHILFLWFLPYEIHIFMFNLN
jgi:hypothetical protein